MTDQLILEEASFLQEIYEAADAVLAGSGPIGLKRFVAIDTGNFFDERRQATEEYMTAMELTKAWPWYAWIMPWRQ